MTWRQREGTLREDVPGTGECVLVDRERGRVLALNVTGAAVWDLLDGERDLAAVARVIAEAAGVTPEQVQPDVERLVEQLVREEFLVACS